MNKDDDFSEIKAKLADLPADKLEEKISYLSIQLRKVVADFDRRIDSFSVHIDYVRKVVALSRSMRELYSKDRISDFERKKQELKERIDGLLRNTLSLYENIRIQKSEKDIIIRIEKEIEVDVGKLRDFQLQRYTVLKSDYAKFSGPVKDKADQALDSEKASISRETQVLVIIKSLLNLVSELDSIMETLRVLVMKEKEALGILNVEKGKSINPIEIMSAEKKLLDTLREIYLLLKDEKKRVHDPFMRMIGQERTGLEQAMQIIQGKRIPWWKKVIGNKHKITVHDINKAMHAFTEPNEYHTFFSALKSHPELLDEDAAKDIDNLFSKSINALKNLGKLAYNDALTKLHNKKYFEEHFSAILKRQAEVSVLIIDIDHFKNFNDRHGHLVGDKVLKEVAEIMKQETRITDIACRWGGEELSIMFPRTNIKDALVVSERLRKAIENHPMADLSGKQIENITVSGGLLHINNGQINEETQRIGIEVLKEHIFEQADGLLYAAKKDGRNRIYYDEYKPFVYI
jgi:diguanylate cyclase (GGDEF)-like protein